MPKCHTRNVQPGNETMDQISHLPYRLEDRSRPRDLRPHYQRYHGKKTGGRRSSKTIHHPESDQLHSQAISENIPLEVLLTRTLDLILSVPWLEIESKGSVFILEDERGVLVMKAQRGLPETAQNELRGFPSASAFAERQH